MNQELSDYKPTVDIHFTTCHHSSVKCRVRTNPGIEGFNIIPWTSEDKLNIAKISLNSLIEFCENIPEKRLSVIDDGSDNLEALKWLNSVPVNVTYYPHRGSSQGINDYQKTIDADLVCHFEDDHVYYNPFNIKWWEAAYDLLKRNPRIGVVTLKSGLPSVVGEPGFNGKWGPVDYKDNIILYRAMGNAHHIMLKETYDKFFPLQGNTGSCEEFMNNRLAELNLYNAELQIPVYAFHSHRYTLPVPENSTTATLNMTGRGIEYGIKEMYELVKSGTHIPCILTNSNYQPFTYVN